MNVLVTGGASGLGGAITRRLAKNNTQDRISFTYHKSADAAARIEGDLPNARAIKCDFRVPQDMDRLLSMIDTMDLGGLVNNALPVGIARKHFHKTELQTFQQGFEYAVLPTVAITQRVIIRFRKNKNGRIVTILTAALIGTPPMGYAAYLASKAYLQSLAKSWASENATSGITSNCVSPGFMATALTSDTDERVVEDLIARHPLHRLLHPDEVAEAVEFYLKCSPQINGTTLAANAAAQIG